MFDLSHLSDQTRGSIYCIAAVLILTPDSLCVRILQEHGLPNFAVIFYRYVLYTSVMIVVHVAKEGKNSVKEFLSIGWMGALCGLVWGVSCLSITYAFQITAVANVLVINSANPIFSALFSRLILKEIIPWRTFIASIVAIIAILIIFSGQLGQQHSGSSLGLFLSLIASSTMGLYFVLLRLTAGPNGYVFNT
jgi:drug/metabolite transporter (DMT)-like permease